MKKLNFNDFKVAVQKQIDKMISTGLFINDVDKDYLWETYLDSFPEGTNEIFRERREYDCQCCKQFIRAIGSVTSIVDNKLISIWDINTGGAFQVVADALSKLVKSKSIENRFLHYENNIGTDFNHQLLESEKTIKWDHFYYRIPLVYVVDKVSIGTLLSNSKSSKDVFKRGLEEISISAIETVFELIEQNSIYRGEEHKASVLMFYKFKKEFEDIIKHSERDNYCWFNSNKSGNIVRIRNTAIGTLLTDISKGMELDKAVRLFESKVAPTNYKRSSAVITKRMIENAQKKIKELGIENSLSRRYAIQEDITINNVLFANREAKKAMNVFDKMIKEAPAKIKNLNKVEEVNIKTFMESILPKADTIEIMVENKHTNNFMSLIAPQDTTSKDIFKWGNNFSWAYNGEVADSMKQRVKKAGGNVEGVLRFSIQWNDGDDNQNDFDAHCIEPDGNLIYYPKARAIQKSSGVLDVDIVEPGHKIAVENITWSNIHKMQEGKYIFLVHNYTHSGGMTGFTAEIEYDGQIYSYGYDKNLRNNEKVIVAEIEFSRETGIKFIKSLGSSQSSKEIWGINTNQFQKVSMIMNSPNHWDDKAIGNKHQFFILENCKNSKPARGFFNEFLKEDLMEHRKVFEVLASKLKVEPNDNQLSGVGFSSTQKNSILCKVRGSFSRIIKINF